MLFGQVTALLMFVGCMTYVWCPAAEVEGFGEAVLHALLDHERAAIIKLSEEWGEIDRSHRKLAHRGSRLGAVHVSESTVLRVLTAEGIVLHVWVPETRLTALDLLLRRRLRPGMIRRWRCD